MRSLQWKLRVPENFEITVKLCRFRMPTGSTVLDFCGDSERNGRFSEEHLLELMGFL